MICEKHLVASVDEKKKVILVLYLFIRRRSRTLLARIKGVFDVYSKS